MKMNPELKQKLDAFIRKYYTNELLKGAFWFVGLSLLYFLLVSVVEAIGRFPANGRFFLFYLLLFGLGGILLYYIVRPLLGLARLGKHLSYKQAAHIIGRHFPEVSDKITNTLELGELKAGENELIQASISQRIALLKPVPFVRAVNYRDNLKYWPVVAVPVAIFLILISLGQWKAITESSRRIALYEREFLEEAPFQFLVLNDSLVVERGDKLEILLRFSGESIPAAAELVWEKGRGRFIRRGNELYEYQLENIQQDITFQIEANGFRSRDYEVIVKDVPELKYMLVQVSPPAYTGISPFQSENPSITVPEGSAVQWSVATITTNEVLLGTTDSSYNFKETEKGYFNLNKHIRNDLKYRIITRNDQISRSGGVDNTVDVIMDEFPVVMASIVADSTRANVYYYQVQMSDDYGLERLELLLEREGKISVLESNRPGAALVQENGGVLNLDSLSKDGGKAAVFFRAWDNDGVNGSKSSTSSKFILQLLSESDKQLELRKEQESYFSESENLQKLSEKLAKEMEELKRKLMNSSKVDWKDKKRLEEILKKQEELLKKQAEMRKMQENIKKKEDKLQPKNEDIKEKEEQLENLRKQIEKEKKLEELMKEIEELMKNMDVEKLKEKLKEMEQENKEMQRSEERLDELMKDLQFQKDVLKEVDKLQKLSEKQEKLSKENNEMGDESKKQEEINKEFEETKKMLDELKKENSEFKEQSEKNESEKTEQEASEEMNKANENLQRNQQQRANENQQNSSEKMQELSEKAMNSLMQMQSVQHQEDMKTLRQILGNLEILSVDVERLSMLSKSSGKSDPLYRKLLVEQKRLQQGSKIIRDSLTALGKRVPLIQEVVYTELGLIDENLEKSIESLQEQQSAKSAAHQQFVMTSANNLALLLDEALRNMQQQMANMMKGNQSCQKPGGGKPSLSNMQKMQSELAKKMGQMKQGNQPGEKSGEGRNGKEIVEMLSRQEMIRRELEGYMKDLPGAGQQGELQRALKEMEDVEKDLMDGEISERTLMRMKTIETRLLQSEKAQREREMDEQRESKSSREQQDMYEEELKQYLKSKETEKEAIFRDPLRMQPYYKDKFRQYLQQK